MAIYKAPYCPLRDFATLRAYSPEIKAQQAIFAFLPVYPELVALIGWNVPNYQGVFLRGYGAQTSYHYGAVGHWSAGLGELQGDGIREISASFSTGGQHGIGGASGSIGVTGGQGYDWKYGESFPICPEAAMEKWASPVHWPFGTKGGING